MSTHRTVHGQRLVIISLVAALVFAVVGVDLIQGASATPSSLYTCTKNGVKFKIVSTPACKTGKHPQTLNTWDNDATVSSAEGTLNSQLTTAMKYETIAHGGIIPAAGESNDFTGLTFVNEDVPLIEGHSSNFSGDDFTNAKLFFLEGSNLTGANFTGATFYPEVSGNPAPEGFFGLGGSSGDNFSNANFTNAVFDGPVNNFEGDNFNGANFTGANFSGNTTAFHDASSTFVGTIWSNTACPDGTNSNTNVGKTCLGHGM